MTERGLAGRTLAGRYDLLALLGAGGMGAVYRAHDRELDELVALKVIKAELASQPDVAGRFRDEVKLARRVTHVNIARTFELGQADGVLYCTMELVEGESLLQRMRRQGTLAIGDAAAIAAELCAGLAAAHAAGVIHRDIKPDNVLLAPGGRVVLADFGVAAAVAGAHTGELSGTPEYMAPEQARGEPPTPATDVYAVGVLLYEMVTGLRAFTGELEDILVAKQDVERLGVPAGVPRELAHVIGRATARELDERVASAAELGRMLAPWTGASPSPPPSPRRPAESEELRTVVVVPPAGDGARMHVAEGIHEELLRRLVRRPRLRVLPRADGVAVPRATVVALHATSDRLAATIATAAVDDGAPGPETTLHVPLEIGSVGLAADAIASAVAEAVRRDRAETATDLEARSLEMLLRARLLAQRSFEGVPDAINLLEHAHALRPEDPRIAATLAMLHVRFVVVGVDDGDYSRARAMVQTALAAAPELADSHVAAGHLELHTGDPVVAASHFRRAIACSPYAAEAHEGLGRLLLEAGFLDVALARLDDALAISPRLNSVRWEIARAHALEENWVAYAAILHDLVRDNDRPIARMRFAIWRGDMAEVAAVHESRATMPGFEPALMDMLHAVAIDRAWPAQRARVLAHVLGSRSPSLRRRAFVAQLGAEAAGFSGDVEACTLMIAHGVANGLHDRHWLERCPLLAAARETPEGVRARAIVQRRAEAILDALYGDVEALSDTVVSPPGLTR